MELFRTLIENEKDFNGSELSFFIDQFNDTNFKKINKYVNIFEIFALYENLIIINNIMNKKSVNLQENNLFNSYIDESIEYYCIENKEEYLQLLDTILNEFLGIGKVIRGAMKIGPSLKKAGSLAKKTAVVGGKTAKWSAIGYGGYRAKNDGLLDVLYTNPKNTKQQIENIPVSSLETKQNSSQKQSSSSAKTDEKSADTPSEVSQTTGNDTDNRSKQKLLSKYTEMIKNNPKKSLAGLGIAGGLGYLAYKAYKNRKKKNETWEDIKNNKTKSF